MSAMLDETYVRECRIEARRNLHGTCFAPAISRAERRQVEHLFAQVFDNMAGDLSGRYFPFARLTKREECELQQVQVVSSRISTHGASSWCKQCEFSHSQMGLLVSRPTGDVALSSGSARDWPDARAVW